ncbi:unnamed protein product [Chrysodeixis includens]|uniref:Uncharacterized protein n=1 Tax=Chrysodeixis includens TaxID=689277 RepID=A0A9N8PYP6_CHRIL|nr:unnamed protein product [Chrysodeixis includens]
MLSCEDFENEVVNCDELVLGSSKTDDGDDAAKLSGKIKTFKEINTDYDIDVQIWKLLDLADADEFMYGCTINFCQSLEDEDAPWYPVLQKLNISSCPVEVTTFEVQGLTISLDSVKDVMCHDFCGNYRVQISFVHLTDKLSCHVLELAIEECDDEYD